MLLPALTYLVTLVGDTHISFVADTRDCLCVNPMRSVAHILHALSAKPGVDIIVSGAVSNHVFLVDVVQAWLCWHLSLRHGQVVSNCSFLKGDGLFLLPQSHLFVTTAAFCDKKSHVHTSGVADHLPESCLCRLIL